MWPIQDHLKHCLLWISFLVGRTHLCDVFPWIGFYQLSFFIIKFATIIFNQGLGKWIDATEQVRIYNLNKIYANQKAYHDFSLLQNYVFVRSMFVLLLNYFCSWSLRLFSHGILESCLLGYPKISTKTIFDSQKNASSIVSLHVFILNRNTTN